MKKEFQDIEKMFKAILILITLPIWFPALMARRVFERLWD